MGASSVRDRARTDLAQLAAARLDNDAFRWEAAAILRRVIGFESWCWLLADPGARLPTRDLGENSVVDQFIRGFSQRHPEAWAVSGEKSAGPVFVSSAVTGGDLAKDPAWRDAFGPAGDGDYMSARLVADGTDWAQLHLHRDSASPFFTEDDAEFVAAVAPMLAIRLRDGLRTRSADGDAAQGEYPAEPGTIIVNEELSVVASTPAAQDWIDRLGLSRPSDTAPLPGFIYFVVARVATARARGAEPPPGARARLQAADGRWTVVRAAPLVSATGGYVITLEAARSEELAPLLMRAWSLTPREREVARLVIDGLSSEDIAHALFISVYTVRDHVKAIFGKTGVSRRQDLTAALSGSGDSR